MLLATETPADSAPPELPKGIDLAVVHNENNARFFVEDSAALSCHWADRDTLTAKECDRLQACSPTGELLQTALPRHGIGLGISLAMNQSTRNLISRSMQTENNFESRFIRQTRYQKLGAVGRKSFRLTWNS